MAHTFVENGRLTVFGEDDVRDALTDGRLDVEVTDPHAELAHAELTRRWMDANDDGASSVLLALRRSDVDALNARVQAARIASGAVDAEAPAVTVQADEDTPQLIRVGERIRMQRNLARTSVKNGMSGEVISLTEDGGMVVSLPTGRGGALRSHTIPATALASGAVALGYAQTVHSAQGVTVDRAFMLADETTDRELLYSGLTRGRDTNELVMMRTSERATSPVEQLATQMVTSSATETALAQCLRRITPSDLFNARRDEPRLANDEEARSYVQYLRDAYAAEHARSVARNHLRAVEAVDAVQVAEVKRTPKIGF